MSTTKEIIDRIMAIKGDVRGATFQTDSQFVISRYGADGLKKVEKKLAEYGHPINYGDINKMGWYPFGLRLASLLTIKETFELDEADIASMGQNAPKVSILVKLVMQFFLDLNKFADKAVSFWKQHYTIGHLENKTDRNNYIRLQVKKIYATLKEVDEETARLFVEIYLGSYFTKITEMGSPGVVTSMTKVVADNEEIYEFTAETK